MLRIKWGLGKNAKKVARFQKIYEFFRQPGGHIGAIRKH
jgi:hypothetical protein